MRGWLYILGWVLVFTGAVRAFALWGGGFDVWFVLLLVVAGSAAMAKAVHDA